MTVNNCNTLIPDDILDNGETVDGSGIARRGIAALFGPQAAILVNKTGSIGVESGNRGRLKFK
ncbi:hypothetical protein [Burkholderia sp. ABCPW 14]|uniref:hypothetical protein n=1 Tax=Burkholderia sp. ABCPW 14 TaxID=1637860 RepID=UPI000AA73435|nr:hypothetical protein [Burkholderia sp. ABCPW 14]